MESRELVGCAPSEVPIRTIYKAEVSNCPNPNERSLTDLVHTPFRSVDSVNIPLLFDSYSAETGIVQ